MAESSNFMQPSIPRFDGHYDHWSMLMENLLRSKEYWNLIENGVITAPAGATQEQQKAANESRLKDLKVLRKEFEILNMKIGESIEDYFSRTLTIANKMKMHGETLSQESNDVTTMTVDELQSSMLVHEQRMKGQREEEQVLKMTNGGRGGKGRGGRDGGRGRGRGGRGKFNKENVECYKCHKLGHMQSECPSWEEDNANYA
ncbi:retrovirus-related Pol polyprotein from transposon TNT 1-94 [Trifolium medium]|uniref:Retrovirus-related Pol polyprotein from transposon TNT 1-94 n=1 Tax=Trifolium medium TaxID=97028 RepID=A0A392MZA7_9FABA|nr:retrovirus-related Pol polyprotein from transposon TNT 1-94 [Trifolium medium]